MNRDSGVLELQKMFAEMDPTSKKAFLNIFDKGFQVWLEAQLMGQTVMQPNYAKG